MNHSKSDEFNVQILYRLYLKRLRMLKRHLMPSDIREMSFMDDEDSANFTDGAFFYNISTENVILGKDGSMTIIDPN